MKANALPGVTPEKAEDGDGPGEPCSMRRTRQVKQEERRSLANYFLSVHEDAQFVSSVHEHFPDFGVLANLRAGLWYTPPAILAGTCYFKSTDGHPGCCDFSIARLNLHVASLAASAGGVLLVDSSRRRRQPDAFSKTVPIWCAVVSAIVLEKQNDEPLNFLHLPASVPDVEREDIDGHLSTWIARLRAALPTETKLELLKVFGSPPRPLRALWVSPDSDLSETLAQCTALRSTHTLVLCVSASRRTVGQADDSSAWSYIPGAGDDSESWPTQALVTPQTFWRHAPELVRTSLETPEALEVAVTLLVQSASDGDKACETPTVVCSHIGTTGLSIGNFVAGGPPGVWDNFDAVLNCGDGEEHAPMREHPRYVSVTVSDNKRADPTKSWWQDRVLPVTLTFAQRHLGERILVHCTRGDTRAPVLVAAILATFFDVSGARLQEPRQDHSKESLRSALAFVQCYHPYCAVPRRLMQQLNLFFVTPQGGWSQWTPIVGSLREESDSKCANSLKGIPEQLVPKLDRWRLDEILPRLLLGNQACAGSLPILKARRVSHIVNVTTSPNIFVDKFQYLQIPIEDDPREDLLVHLWTVLQYIHEALQSTSSREGVDGGQVEPGVVLVHCREGVSRSVSVVLAYLMAFEGYGLEDAIMYLRSLRHDHSRSRPNHGFMDQLREFEVSLTSGAAS